MQINLILAADRNNAIGYLGNCRLPWHIPSDLMRFKKETMGYPIIMGYNTFASFKNPLPGRKHLVITSSHVNEVNEHKDCIAVSSPGAALIRADKSNADKVYIIGGASIYNQFIEMDLVDRILLTRVHTRLVSSRLAKVNLSFLDTKYSQTMFQKSFDPRDDFETDFTIFERTT